MRKTAAWSSAISTIHYKVKRLMVMKEIGRAWPEKDYPVDMRDYRAVLRKEIRLSRRRAKKARRGILKGGPNVSEWVEMRHRAVSFARLLRARLRATTLRFPVQARAASTQVVFVDFVAAKLPTQVGPCDQAETIFHGSFLGRPRLRRASGVGTGCITGKVGLRSFSGKNSAYWRRR
jgi:hypothetical protein